MVNSKYFNVYVRQDRIIVTTLESFGRRAVEEWMNYARNHTDNLVPPVRLLYDFRKAGAPSKFLLDTLEPFLESLNIPPDTRNAYLFASPFEMFAHSLMRRLPQKAGLVRAFDTFDEGVAWLLAEDPNE